MTPPNIRLFVSTKETQGQRANDFCFVPVGEIVLPHPFSICTNGSVDDDCGCHRSLSGLICNKATTTAMVVDYLIEPKELITLITNTLIRQGYEPILTAVTVEHITTVVRDLLNALDFEPGTIIEYRNGLYQARKREETTYARTDKKAEILL